MIRIIIVGEDNGVFSFIFNKVEIVGIVLKMKVGIFVPHWFCYQSRWRPLGYLRSSKVFDTIAPITTFSLVITSSLKFLTLCFRGVRGFQRLVRV